MGGIKSTTIFRTHRFDRTALRSDPCRAAQARWPVTGLAFDVPRKGEPPGALNAATPLHRPFPFVTVNAPRSGLGAKW